MIVKGATKATSQNRYFTDLGLCIFILNLWSLIHFPDVNKLLHDQEQNFVNLYSNNSSKIYLSTACLLVLVLAGLNSFRKIYPDTFHHQFDILSSYDLYPIILLLNYHSTQKSCSIFYLLCIFLKILLCWENPKKTNSSEVTKLTKPNWSKQK